MRRLLVSAVCFVSLACAHRAPTPSPAALVTPVESLGFLTGTWRSEGPKLIEEVWTQPAGDSLLGVGRTITADGLAHFEYMRIDRSSGALAFTAQPNGGSPVTFVLTAMGHDEAVFENPEHDFPQRIVYRREADGLLSARIEGPGRKGWERIEFRYRRVK